jgi:hypothetical protein
MIQSQDQGPNHRFSRGSMFGIDSTLATAALAPATIKSLQAEKIEFAWGS